MEMARVRVKNLPGALSTEAIALLLQHYGASRVQVLGPPIHVGAASRTALADFDSPDARLQAMRRLEQVELAGRRLHVEALQKDPSASIGKAIVPPPPPPLPGYVPRPAMPRPPPPPPAAPRYPPVPLAPHLGLHYAPSPQLHYKYPRASIPIVCNIANALLALPRLYTQVLHLMNKMNLPLPFEREAIVGPFAPLRFEVDMDEIAKLQQSQAGASVSKTKPEEEEEDDEEDETTRGCELKAVGGAGGPATAPIEPSVTVDPARGKTDTTAKHSWQLPAANKKRRRVSVEVPDTFSVETSTTRSNIVRAGVISSAEVQQLRLSSTELAQHPSMRNYERGEPSSCLLISNVADSVDEKDLQSIVGYVLPTQFEIESLDIHISRTEQTALVNLPSIAIAEAAVDALHGLVLDDIPLIMCFHPSPGTTPQQPTETSSAQDHRSVLSVTNHPYFKMASEDLAQEKAMRLYDRGEPSAAIYLKNMAKSLQEDALRAICSAFLPDNIHTDDVRIRHFTEGKMKNQAFIELPSIELATLLLDSLHGLMVDKKPLVVSFRKLPKQVH